VATVSQNNKTLACNFAKCWQIFKKPFTVKGVYCSLYHCAENGDWNRHGTNTAISI